MQSRLLRLAASSVRDVAAYNAGRADPADRLPRIVIVIDDYSDLLANSNEIEDPVIRLSGNASAAGIHLVLATHRPSLNVITSVVKANFRARIAFRTISEADSLAVLEAAGAEQLVGAGDMLYQPPDVPEPVRIQGLLVADVDIARITAHWMAQRPAPTHGLSIVAAPAAQQPAGLAEPTDDPDPLISDAVAAIQESRYASASLLMRKLRVGYARAARIIDQLEARGHVGPIDGSNARVVLHPDPPAPADDPDDAPQPWIARQARIEARLSDEDWLRQHEAMEHERLRGDHGPR
jgi:S-DNA-T family DNA segregation ATPase FtsK/SpoIIIE